MADDINYETWPTSAEVNSRLKPAPPSFCETAERQFRSAAVELGRATGWLGLASPNQITDLRASVDLCERALANAIAWCEGRKSTAEMEAESAAILEAVKEGACAVKRERSVL